jgi:hypothetical protein
LARHSRDGLICGKARFVETQPHDDPAHEVDHYDERRSTTSDHADAGNRVLDPLKRSASGHRRWLGVAHCASDGVPPAAMTLRMSSGPIVDT